MKQTILTVTTLSLVLAVLFYFGGIVLMAGLGVIGLVAVILLSFAIGSYWTKNLIMSGAQIAIESTSRNDEYDTRKIEALSNYGKDVAKEAIKAKNKSLPAGSGYPALPPSFVEGSFTIAGLDDEEMEQ